MIKMNNKERAREMFRQRYEEGRTLQEIAYECNLTRQRVHQILVRYSRATPPKERKVLLDAQLKRYLECNLNPRCARCHEDVEIGRGPHMLCKSCLRHARVVRQLKDRLRSVKEGRGLVANERRMAAYIIRKYDLRPEDLYVA